MLQVRRGWVVTRMDGAAILVYMKGSCLLNPGVTSEHGSHNYDARIVLQASWQMFVLETWAGEEMTEKNGGTLFQRPRHALVFFNIFCWPCILLWFLANDQLDAQFFLCIYFNSLHVSNNPLLIIRRINCINTISGIYHCLWHIPDVVLIQLILLMMSKRLLDTCRELK